MTTEPEMKIDYTLVLQQLQDDLATIDERRQALLASIAAIRRLVRDACPEQPDFADDVAGHIPNAEGGVRMPTIPPGVFAGMSPTEGFRELMRMWPGYYRPPQIASLFEQGGMLYKTRTELIQAIHSVLKRERQRALKNTLR